MSATSVSAHYVWQHLYWEHYDYSIAFIMHPKVGLCHIGLVPPNLWFSELASLFLVHCGLLLPFLYMVTCVQEVDILWYGHVSAKCYMNR